MNELNTTQSNLPAVKPKPPRGFEGESDNVDLRLPRVKLLQALSPECSDESLDLKAGQIINSLTKEVLPGEFIPIYKGQTFIRFNPRNTKDENYDQAYGPGEMIYRTTDPTDGRVVADIKFGPNGERPACTKFLNFLSYFPDVPMPIILSFCNTSYKTGRQLLSLAKFANCDMFSRKYRLFSKHETKNGNEYYVFAVSPSGIATEEEYSLAEQWYDQYAPKKDEIQFEHEGESKPVTDDDKVVEENWK